MRSPNLELLAVVLASTSAIACGASGDANQARAPSHSHTEHRHEAEAAESGPAVFSSEGERVAYENARPVFETYCAGCHESSGPKSNPKAQDHFDMDTYPFGGHHSGAITAAIRKSLGTTGSPPTMPKDKPGAVEGDALRAVLNWADAYDQAHPVGIDSKTHDHGDHVH